MGLPLAPSTTYVANSTPVIKAQDLNDIQQYLAGLYSGVYTVKTLFANGTGGNPATQLPGLVVANGLVTHTTPRTPVAYSAGTVAQGTVARGWAVVNADGTLARGYNVYAVTGGSGVYYVRFDGFPTDPTHACVWATLMDSSELTSIIAIPTSVGGRVEVIVEILAGGGPAAHVPKKFSVGVFAE